MSAIHKSELCISPNKNISTNIYTQFYKCSGFKYVWKFVKPIFDFLDNLLNTFKLKDLP